ncbi:kinase-like domain-containing protein [Gigaspora rosea]|uniref:Kinase-like domain-containing protein n=1 Tax=Gigaspora rosea TaxID=44941 RepID=A0A397V4F6_9GLOM|nr:kinase-like domain-containing protein [Gigaspora rosea]
MLVSDLKRSEFYGKCANCNRYNTSLAWCQTCDPQKTTQEWTSGNNDIDNCIKEFQLKATKYENVIEWIPFNRLDNIRNIGDKFLATWLGKRYADHKNEDGYMQSRTSSCVVELKTLTGSQNLLDTLKELKNYIKLKGESVYGLTQNTITNEYMLVFHGFGSNEFVSNERERCYGVCANCNRYNTSEAWCQTCDPQKTTQGWTSGNKEVDDCIKEFQLNIMKYTNVVEWIPFNRLENFQKIGEGGFGSVFSATWLDGKRIISGEECHYTQSRTPSFIVVLKTLPGSQKNFLREFKSYMRFRLLGSNLEVYGLTQNTTNNEYLMAFQYANKGSLHKFLLSNFRELNWKSKLNQLLDISKNLEKLHIAEYVHGDFHSGNILQNQYMSGDLISYIADLGLSRKKDETDLEDSIYGVLPYVAPEVLIERSYTIASDIYSFGIIMTEVSTGRPPHYDIEYNEILAFKICNGLRPEFAKGTPECYIQLANHCMDANPSNRPTASYILEKLFEWHGIVDRGIAMNKNELTILNSFQLADAIISTLPTELPICTKDKLTSKLLNFRGLSKPINSFEKLPKLCSRKCDFSISDDFISPNEETK